MKGMADFHWNGGSWNALGQIWGTFSTDLGQTNAGFLKRRDRRIQQKKNFWLTLTVAEKNIVEKKGQNRNVSVHFLGIVPVTGFVTGFVTFRYSIRFYETVIFPWWQIEFLAFFTDFSIDFDENQDTVGNFRLWAITSKNKILVKSQHLGVMRRCFPPYWKNYDFHAF